MKKNLLIAISVLTLVCGVCSVGAATTSDTTASGSAVTVENKHKDGERQKGDMAKVTAVTSDTITVTKAEKPEKPDNATDDTNRPEPPAKADGDTATPPEKPSANDDGTDRPEPPTKPDGDTATPEKHSGEKGEKPEMKFSSECLLSALSGKNSRRARLVANAPGGNGFHHAVADAVCLGRTAVAYLAVRHSY